MKQKLLNFDFFLLRQTLSLYWYDLRIMLRSIPSPRPKKIGAETKIHFIYFSCGSDFLYLFTSLKSLERLKFKSRGNIYLYIDRKDPLRQEQLQKLETELTMHIIVRSTKYDFANGLGVWVILSELAAFREVAGEISLNDYVAKVDADVLFVSEKAFLEVIKSGYEAVGDVTIRVCLPPGFPHFMQGGCYFIKCAQAIKILQQPIAKAAHETVKEVRVSDWPKCTLVRCPEDKTISKLIQKCGCKINYADLFFYPDQKIMEGHTVSAYHFTNWYGLKKEAMLEAWQTIKTWD